MRRYRSIACAMKYFEDIEVGETRQLTSIKNVTRDEVIGFALQFDPQPFHLDDEAAAKTHFGKISASGWHTAAMTMRMMVDDTSGEETAGLGSPGLDSLRWAKPVYPEDTLRCEVETVSKRRSKNRPEMGLVSNLVTTYNQHDDVVMTMESIVMIALREPDSPMEE